jgi:hypothetical protein
MLPITFSSLRHTSAPAPTRSHLLAVHCRFGRLADMRTTYWNRKKGGKRAQEAVRLGKVRLYTFGAPRVGNSEFARDFDAMGIEAYRIVNGEARGGGGRGEGGEGWVGGGAGVAGVVKGAEWLATRGGRWEEIVVTRGIWGLIHIEPALTHVLLPCPCPQQQPRAIRLTVRPSSPGPPPMPATLPSPRRLPRLPRRRSHPSPSAAPRPQARTSCLAFRATQTRREPF